MMHQASGFRTWVIKVKLFLLPREKARLRQAVGDMIPALETCLNVGEVRAVEVEDVQVQLLCLTAHPAVGEARLE